MPCCNFCIRVFVRFIRAVNGCFSITHSAISEIEAKIPAQSSDESRQALVRSRLIKISMRLHNKLSDAGWTTKREIVQRIEIGQTKVAVILRVPTDTSGRALDPIMVTLSRA